MFSLSRRYKGLGQHHRSAAMAATGYVLERLSELREEAYCKVLRCFLASQQYDLVSINTAMRLLCASLMR